MATIKEEAQKCASSFLQGRVRLTVEFVLERLESDYYYKKKIEKITLFERKIFHADENLSNDIYGDSSCLAGDGVRHKCR